jgi:hypothetical protein
VRLHGDDLPFVRPHLFEEGEQELAPLNGFGLQVPEALEVAEEGAGAVDGGLGGRAEALEFFLDRLAVHDVLRFGEVAEHVEVAQAL